MTTCTRSIDFEVANFGLRKKTCRNTAYCSYERRTFCIKPWPCANFVGAVHRERGILRGKRSMWWSFIVWSGVDGGVWTLESTKAGYSEYSERFITDSFKNLFRKRDVCSGCGLRGLEVSRISRTQRFNFEWFYNDLIIKIQWISVNISESSDHLP